MELFLIYNEVKIACHSTEEDSILLILQFPSLKMVLAITLYGMKIKVKMVAKKLLDDSTTLLIKRKIIILKKIVSFNCFPLNKKQNLLD